MSATETSRLLARRLATETRGEVLFSGADRGRYATDASIYQIMPVGVFVPKTQSDAAIAIAIARDLKVPVLARGAGTSQCGQTVGAALVIDTSKYLRNILEVDVKARTARVEPGLVLDHLNAALKPHGLWHAVDVSTSAQANRWASCAKPPQVRGAGSPPGPTASTARSAAGTAQQISICVSGAGLPRVAAR